MADGLFGEWPTLEPDGAPPSPDAERRVLFVCTGNIARSAAAERIARARHAGIGLEYDSAGIGALVGRPVADDVEAAVRARGADPGPHVAKQVTRALVDGAGLILVADVEHRDWLLEEWPDLVHRVALLREAAAVAAALADDPDGAAGSEPGRLPAARRLVDRCGHSRRWGIADPYRRGPVRGERAVAEVEQALAVLLPLYAASVRR
ncbi:MAG: hypothetical protein GXX90_03560 [Microbacteriaceae bacterium]|nr:hypothetical protein [Microbacteriaceae bacterium]